MNKKINKLNIKKILKTILVSSLLITICIIQNYQTRLIENETDNETDNEKIIAEVTNLSTYNNSNINLNNFHNILQQKDLYTVSTNKFICEGENLTCNSSEKYNNIGLINVDEFNKIGGFDSYLKTNSSYFTLTEAGNLVEKITNNNIESVTHDSISGLRPVVYVPGETKVTGTGKYEDPYIFKEKTYIVKINAKNGTTSPTTAELTHAGSYTFIAMPNDGYKIDSSKINCDKTVTINIDENKIVISNVLDNTTCSVEYSPIPLLADKILADNPNVSTRSDFSTIFTTSNNGNTIYKASGQDGKDTYYFAGYVTNNYVKFGTNSSGQELWWRIVRINEDNSVRLIYAGLSATDTAAYVSINQKYNSINDNSAYVGYMYTKDVQRGTNTNSGVKTIVDNWYAENLENYDGYISKTAIYCNDRTVGIGSWSATGSAFAYSGYKRIWEDFSPTFMCSNLSDRFTISKETGNGKLTYPIGLITMDEVYYAGGITAENPNYYIAQNASSLVDYWWTMTPHYWYKSNKYASVFLIGALTYNGRIGYSNAVEDVGGVRPVISLKACVTTNEGNGTASNPYIISLSDTCSNVDNEIPKQPVRISVATNDTSMATVNAPSSVMIENGGNYTFTIKVNNGYTYESLSNCGGATYDVTTNTLTFKSVSENTTCIVNYKPIERNLYEQILIDNPNISTRNSFSTTFTTSNNGNTIYKASGQNGKNTYYFAGEVTNNYVKFGTNSSGQELWWRIVRINEDNSVRLIYAGLSANDPAGFIGGSAYNEDHDNSAYVGYMYTLNQQYGNSTSSKIKITIDNWYAENLEKYDDCISKTAIYCSDRTIGDGTWTATDNKDFYFSAIINRKNAPAYSCSNQNDRFTVSTSSGNGKLEYPIGLITFDEVIYAGGYYLEGNSNYYLYDNAKTSFSNWWTMTPFGWVPNYFFTSDDFSTIDAGVFKVGASVNSGRIYIQPVDNTYGVRPVISLKSCIHVASGNGTASNPYTIGISDTCSNLEN